MEPESEADEGPVLFSFESNQNNGFLSPAFLSSFEYGHTEYNCSEQFFQATKATFFIEDNYELYRAIMSATDPEEQKALGKHIKGNHASWHHWGLGKAYQVIKVATRLKFQISEHTPMLLHKLMATEHRELVMADLDDAFLGIGLDRISAAAHVGPWPGRNLLGKY
ncbi:unnamed protein product [Alternaria alternata]